MKAEERQRLGLATSAFFAAAATALFLQGKRRSAHRFGAISAGAFLVPTLIRNCAWWGPVTKRFPASGREVWLTIDDGPDPDETPRVLDVLRSFGARATFFCIGQRVNERPDLARAAKDAGHTVENHTYSHPAFSFWAAPPRWAAEEIRRGSQAIREATGEDPTLFRAPAGLANAFVHRQAQRAKLRMVGWSASGHDGIAHDPHRTVQGILTAAVPGSIILMHENRLPGMRPGQRSETLGGVLAGLERLGLRTIIPDLAS